MTDPVSLRATRKNLGRPMALDLPDHQRLTPPCGSCGLPLVKSDKHCPRCGRAVPWKVAV